jgi:hypothetical protein
MPTEVYYKTRRLSLIFAGTLLVMVLVGITGVEKELSIIPFKLAEPGNLPHIVAAVLLYSIWHFVASWDMIGPHRVVQVEC